MGDGTAVPVLATRHQADELELRAGQIVWLRVHRARQFAACLAVRVSAKVDYAVRASIELAAAHERDGVGKPGKAETLARAQEIPLKFLENILQGLRQAAIVEIRRGPEGGHVLARPAAHISIADVIRAIDGALAGVGGRRPDELPFSGGVVAMKEVWSRCCRRWRMSPRGVAEARGGALTADPRAWAKR